MALDSDRIMKIIPANVIIFLKFYPFFGLLAVINRTLENRRFKWCAERTFNIPIIGSNLKINNDVYRFRWAFSFRMCIAILATQVNVHPIACFEWKFYISYHSRWMKLLILESKHIDCVIHITSATGSIALERRYPFSMKILQRISHFGQLLEQVWIIIVCNDPSSVVIIFVLWTWINYGKHLLIFRIVLWCIFSGNRCLLSIYLKKKQLQDEDKLVHFFLSVLTTCIFLPQLWCLSITHLNEFYHSFMCCFLLYRWNGISQILRRILESGTREQQQNTTN